MRSLSLQRDADPFANSPFRGAHMNLLSFVLALVLLPLPVATPGVGSLTLMEGSIRVIRGPNVMKGVEGMRLLQGDILESSDVGFAQLEFAGGSVIALGPESRLYVSRHSGDRAVAGKDVAKLLLLSGWVKGESAVDAGLYQYETPTLAARVAGGTVLIHAFGDQSEAFLESGSATIGEVHEDGNVRQPVAAKAGQFFLCRAGKSMEITMRPNPAFVEAMPKPFRDTLPARLGHFAGKPVEPKVDHLVSYAEVESYLRMPPTWRRGIAERFQSRLKDAEFRKQVEAHIVEHPEWNKILHPESKEPAEKPSSISKPS